jgi:hypothetical protein
LKKTIKKQLKKTFEKHYKNRKIPKNPQKTSKNTLRRLWKIRKNLPKTLKSDCDKL